MTLAEYIAERVRQEDIKQSNTLLYDIIDAAFIQRCITEFQMEGERPDECEDIECAHCPLYYDKLDRQQIGCPYVD